MKKYVDELLSQNYANFTRSNFALIILKKTLNNLQDNLKY